MQLKQHSPPVAINMIYGTMAMYSGWKQYIAIDTKPMRAFYGDAKVECSVLTDDCRVEGNVKVSVGQNKIEHTLIHTQGKERFALHQLFVSCKMIEDVTVIVFNFR